MARSTHPIGTFSQGAQLFKQIRNYVRKGRHPLLDQEITTSTDDANSAESGVNLANPGARAALTWGTKEVPKSTHYSLLLAEKFETSARTVDRILTILRYADKPIQGDLEAGRISITAAYKRSIQIRDRDRIIEAATEVVPGDLGETLIAFQRQNIPTDHSLRTWNKDELALFERLVECLHFGRILAEEPYQTLALAIRKVKGRF